MVVFKSDVVAEGEGDGNTLRLGDICVGKAVIVALAVGVSVSDRDAEGVTP